MPRRGLSSELQGDASNGASSTTGLREVSWSRFGDGMGFLLKSNGNLGEKKQPLVVYGDLLVDEQTI